MHRVVYDCNCLDFFYKPFSFQFRKRLPSTKDSDIEAPPSSGSEAEHGALDVERAEWGEDVLYTPGYFSLSNYPKQGLRMRILPTWTTKEHLGVTDMSKGLQVGMYDADPAVPTISSLVLRSWMLRRSAANGWLEKRIERQRWHARELRKLQQDIQAIAHVSGGTGSSEADALIKNWCSAALPP